jgi:hypothetical protein
MGVVNAHEVTLEGLTHIVRNMRERDRREIFALRWDDDEDALIRDILHVAGAMWRVWTWDGEPVAVNGVIPMRPGVVICGAFGTDKWRLALRPITHWSRDFIIPALQHANYHRGEAYVLAANTDSRRWIEMLGGKIETLLQGYGRNREDFLLYVWDLTRSDDHVHRRRPRQQRPAIRDDALCGPSDGTSPVLLH